MPKAVVVKPPTGKELPDTLRVFDWHGVDLAWRPGEANAVGDCPFCGAEGKFTVSAEKGTARCWVCTVNPESENGGVNHLSFIRCLWKLSLDRTNGETDQLVRDRKLLFPDTVHHWGLAWSATTFDWLVPSWSHDRKLVQLYRWMPEFRDGRLTGKHRLYPTPTLGGNGLFMPVDSFDPKKGSIHHHESLWNAMAAWEVMRQAKQGEDGLALTGSEASSLMADCNVTAGQGCGSVGEPLRRSMAFFQGKDVTLLFDNDHPKEANGAMTDGAGLAAVKRAVKILDGKAESLSWLEWGEDGHAAYLPSGHDVRDVLGANSSIVSRLGSLAEILGNVKPVPQAWLEAAPVAVHSGGHAIEPLHCDDWHKLRGAWKEALQWRQELEDVLAMMLAVCASTELEGESQAFLQVIGSAGGGKTRLAEALLVSRRCHKLIHLTNFFSGWRDKEGNDHSLISQINRLTLVTPEADAIFTQVNFNTLMGQLRQIFDGNTSIKHGNKLDSTEYTGLRTPWIIAGTPAMMLGIEQAHLGDRFLKVYIEDPNDADLLEIGRRVAYNAMFSSERVANDGAASCLSPELLRAYRLTGGYVDWLRNNAADLIGPKLVTRDKEAFATTCWHHANFTADLRARPQMDPKKEDHNTKELPTRLTAQFVRMARCLAAVMNRSVVDEPLVMRLVGKLSRDTARGKTLDMVKCMALTLGGECSAYELHHWTHQGEDRCASYLRFLKRMKVAEMCKPTDGGKWRWRLTPRMRQLWMEVME